MKLREVYSARMFSLVFVLMLACFGIEGCTSASEQAQSAEFIPFEPAFVTGYDQALDAAREKADDVKLLAVQSASFSQAHFPSQWVFLFYSWQRVSAYTVEISDGDATVVDNPGISLTLDDYNAIPNAPEIVIDADEAYRRVVDTLDGEGSFITCRAYYIAYDSGDTNSRDTSSEWIFSFNEQENLKEVYLDPAEQIAPASTYSVDVVTGEVSKVD